MDKAIEFQDVVASALNAHYTDNMFEENTSLRLVTAYKTRNVSFAKTMRLYGHKYHFERGLTVESDDEDAPINPPVSEPEPDDFFVNAFAQTRKVHPKKKAHRRMEPVWAEQVTPIGFDTSEADSDFWSNKSPTKSKGNDNVDPISIREQATPQGLDMLEEQRGVTIPKKNEIKDWLKTRYLKTRGLELGTFQPSNLTSAFVSLAGCWYCSRYMS